VLDVIYTVVLLERMRSRWEADGHITEYGRPLHMSSSHMHKFINMRRSAACVALKHVGSAVGVPLVRASHKQPSSWNFSWQRLSFLRPASLLGRDFMSH